MKFYAKVPLITYDDVLIRPGYSTLNSRQDAKPEINFGKYKLSPIIASNMTTIATPRMQAALAPFGCIVPFDRNQSILEEVSCITGARRGMTPIAASVGLNDRERTIEVAKLTEWLFLELAYADSKNALTEIAWLRKEFPNKVIVVGNVATREAVDRLATAGADIVKVGIGPGGVCSTRSVTGCGVPQLSAVIECSQGPLPIIADGGIRTSGDIVKALAAGAQFVMVGSLLAGTDETPGMRGSRVYKGMASKDAQVDKNGELPEGIVPEGVSISVPDKGPAKHIILDLLAGLRQGMSMVGARTLTELREKAVFQFVSGSTVIENAPHFRERLRLV